VIYRPTGIREAWGPAVGARQRSCEMAQHYARPQFAFDRVIYTSLAVKLINIPAGRSALSKPSRPRRRVPPRTICGSIQSRTTCPSPRLTSGKCRADGCVSTRALHDTLASTPTILAFCLLSPLANADAFDASAASGQLMSPRSATRAPVSITMCIPCSLAMPF